MPALFAYLVAVCVLLSGGYGALNWLSRPEPVKLLVKAHPKPKPSYETELPISSTALDENANPAVAFNLGSPSGAGAAEAGAQPSIETAGSPLSQQSRSANAEVHDDGAKQPENDVKQPVRIGSSGNVGTDAASDPGTIAKPWKRSPSRQGSKRPEKRALALMTLRTIEFPDGRRTTQLIPYRGSYRALAFQLGE